MCRTNCQPSAKCGRPVLCAFFPQVFSTAPRKLCVLNMTASLISHAPTRVPVSRNLAFPAAVTTPRNVTQCARAVSRSPLVVCKMRTAPATFMKGSRPRASTVQRVVPRASAVEAAGEDTKRNDGLIKQVTHSKCVVCGMAKCFQNKWECCVNRQEVDRSNNRLSALFITHPN